MSGNLWEWCNDNWSLYGHEPSQGIYVLRGGSWSNIARVCRVTYRTADGLTYVGNDVGLRLAL